MAANSIASTSQLTARFAAARACRTSAWRPLQRRHLQLRERDPRGSLVVRTLATAKLKEGSSDTEVDTPPPPFSGPTFEDTKSSSSLNAKVLASAGVVGGLLLLAGGSVLLKEPLHAFLNFFIAAVDEWGPLGYVAYIVCYAALEVLAVPALPLTMTAGAIFGVPAGLACVSCGGTIAATIAFLIARYVARDRVVAYAAGHPKFAAIDRAIGADGFRVVVLLRLSPLLPLSASNYLYGLTSVGLVEYVLGSWIGMLPGTAAFVTAGTYGKQLLLEGGGGVEGFNWWQAATAAAATGAAVAYLGSLAKKALEEAEESSGGSL